MEKISRERFTGYDYKQIPRIIKSIESLAKNPFSRQYRKLQGTDNFYRIRVGDYRVVYQVDTNKDFLTIYYVRHRREAYRKRK
ncbi:type II toxin-antitoxin system RelE/ParE family toxin [Candidatus Atribacteria bacterium MT.SAG.1]|nr:type II toxin-antitoxin system RelE/ParE family toxin [Candidatus Atribacteria bacterium MT.SAG.1]